MDLTIFRQKVEEEIRAILLTRGSPLFGLEAMTAYHMGFADQKGELRDGAKGKYMRPIFCMAICAGLGGDPEKAIPAAASLELIHRTTLIFDDIQDAGKERNDQPTVWTVWGVDQAINAGLSLSCHARLATQRGLQRGIPPETALRILSILENAVLELCQGQFLDVSFQETVSVTQEDYFRMVREKTGALFGAACEVGALCAGAREEKIALARELGINMGIAFQVHDDYLGIWGDEKKVGKTANDLTEKKRSLPVILALEKYPGPMTHWLQMKTITPEEAKTIKFWMTNRGMAEEVSRCALDYAVRAQGQLNALSLDEGWLHEVNKFLEFGVSRDK